MANRSRLSKVTGNPLHWIYSWIPVYDQTVVGDGSHGSIGDSVLIHSREMTSHYQGASIASKFAIKPIINSYCNGDIAVMSY